MTADWLPGAGDQVAVYRPGSTERALPDVQLTHVDHVTDSGVATPLGVFTRPSLTLIGGTGRLLPVNHSRVLAARAAEALVTVTLTASGALSQVMALRVAAMLPDAALGALAEIETQAREARERIEALREPRT